MHYRIESQHVHCLWGLPHWRTHHNIRDRLLTHRCATGRALRPRLRGPCLCCSLSQLVHRVVAVAVKRGAHGCMHSGCHTPINPCQYPFTPPHLFCLWVICYPLGRLLGCPLGYASRLWGASMSCGVVKKPLPAFGACCLATLMAACLAWAACQRQLRKPSFRFIRDGGARTCGRGRRLFGMRRQEVWDLGVPSQALPRWWLPFRQRPLQQRSPAAPTLLLRCSGRVPTAATQLFAQLLRRGADKPLLSFLWQHCDALPCKPQQHYAAVVTDPRNYMPL